MVCPIHVFRPAYSTLTPAITTTLNNRHQDDAVKAKNTKLDARSVDR